MQLSSISRFLSEPYLFNTFSLNFIPCPTLKVLRFFSNFGVSTFLKEKRLSYLSRSDLIGFSISLSSILLETSTITQSLSCLSLKGLISFKISSVSLTFTKVLLINSFFPFLSRVYEYRKFELLYSARRVRRLYWYALYRCSS